MADKLREAALNGFSGKDLKALSLSPFTFNLSPELKFSGHKAGFTIILKYVHET